MEPIVSSLGPDVSILTNYEDMFQEGETGEIHFYLSTSITQEQITQIEQEIMSKGVVLTAPITQDAGIVCVKFRRMMIPLLIIGVALAGLVGSGILGWQIFKNPLGTTIMGLPWWVVLGGGAAKLFLLFKTPTAQKAIKSGSDIAISAGKLYLTKGVIKNPIRNR